MSIPATTDEKRGLIGGTVDINVLLAFVFGVIFLSIMLGFAVFFPNPADFQLKVFITCLALAAAGVGAILPGFFEIRYKSVLRATGAAAFFVMVYATQPALVRQVATFVPGKGDASVPALTFMKQLDDGKPDAAFAQLDPDASIYFGNLPTFQLLYTNSRAPIGAAQSRALVATNAMTNPNGWPPGSYEVLTYRTKFADGCRAETSALRAGQDLAWHMWSYTISPPIPCTG